MADKPKDNKPATEFGEVKVIKNEPSQTKPETKPAKKSDKTQSEVER